MASTTKESITVKQLSKFGFQLESGEYVGWSKNISPKQQGMVVPGGVFDMEIYKAESGKRYCNAVFEGRVVASKPAPLPAAVAKPVTTKATLSKTETMSRSDWDAKDIRISRQGVIQVAVQVTSSFEDATVLADKMLAYVRAEGK